MQAYLKAARRALSRAFSICAMGSSVSSINCAPSLQAVSPPSAGVEFTQQDNKHSLSLEASHLSTGCAYKHSSYESTQHAGR